jgi:hypothetical protein
MSCSASSTLSVDMQHWHSADMIVIYTHYSKFHPAIQICSAKGADNQSMNSEMTEWTQLQGFSIRPAPFR